MNARFGRYVLESRLAAGGMGEVWVATLPMVGGIAKPCVLKRIRADHAADREFVRMFVEEARVSLSLQHGNIVPAFDFGEVDGQLYLAMDFVDGRNLGEILRELGERGRVLDVSLAVFVAIEVCRGLSYLHGKADPGGRPLGLVHRDISPSNVIVSMDGDVKIVDFGIAKVRSRTRETAAGVVKGKLAYMAPEQACGDAVDARTDIFAVGVVLAELLSGRSRFDAVPREEQLDRVRRGTPVSLRRHRPDLPVLLDDIVGRATASRPDDRFPDAASLQVALVRFLATHDPGVTSSGLAAVVRDLFASTRPSIRQTDPEPAGGPFQEALLAVLPGRRHTVPEARSAHPTRPERPPGSRVPAPEGPIVPEKSWVWSSPEPSGTATEPSAGAPSRALTARRAKSVSWLLASLALIAVAAGALGAIVRRELAASDSESETPALRTSAEAPSWSGRAPAPSPQDLAPTPTPTARDLVPASPPQSEGGPREPAVEVGRDAVRSGTASRPRATGALLVNSVPWSRVFVDGRLRAQSTPARIELPAGRHTVKLVSPASGSLLERSVEIRAGERVLLSPQRPER